MLLLPEIFHGLFHVEFHANSWNFHVHVHAPPFKGRGQKNSTRMEESCF